MSERTMRLVLNRPTSGGEVRVRGTRLLTPDGSDVTGIASIRIDLRPDGFVETTIVLRKVVVEHAEEEHASP